MKLGSVGIWRPRLLREYRCWRFGNAKNVFGRRYCSLLYPIFIYFKISTPFKISLYKCSKLLWRNSSYFRLLVFSKCLVLFHLSYFWGIWQSLPVCATRQLHDVISDRVVTEWYRNCGINMSSWMGSACKSSWWWVSTPETWRAAYRNIINCISRILLDSY